MASPQIHPKAIVETDNVGSGTTVWAFAHILPGASVGRDCNICDGVFIEGGASVGDRVTIKCGVQIWDGVTIEDDVFVGPNVTFTNDPFPRSKVHLKEYSKTLVRKGASIGANATILPNVTVGPHAMVGAGAVVTKSVPQNAIVVGNPAQIVGYCDSPKNSVSEIANLNDKEGELIKSKVPGVTVQRLPTVLDLRGNLSFGEFEKHIPFPVKRFFFIYDVPSKEVRGEHAHWNNHQFLICIKGSARALVDNGSVREEFILDSPSIGIHIPPMIWGTQYQYSNDAVLVVFASHLYDPADYIREHDEFLKAVAQ